MSNKHYNSKFYIRLIIYAVVVFSTVFFPVCYGFPKLNGADKGLIFGTLVVVVIIETLAFYYFQNKRVIKPTKRITEVAKIMAEGDYDANIKTAYGDCEIIELTKAVNALSDEFSRLEDKRKTFISNTSHELRSPLTSIQGFLQAIIDGTVSKDEVPNYLNIVYTETKRLSSLINSMLDLSRLESGRNPVVKSPFELNSAIREVVNRFEQSLIAKQLVLDLNFVQEFTYVFADKDKIIQVLVNLIDNAIKYSAAYSRIIVATRISAKKVYVSVKDNGFGISKKDQSLIWDRFYMTDKARTPIKSKGSGLGLSIVKKILDDHEESIRVESEKGMGSTFIFSLTLSDFSINDVNSDKIIKAISNKIDDTAQETTKNSEG